MPRRKRLPVAAPGLHQQGAVRPTSRAAPQSPSLVPFGDPQLDAALAGGLPLGRLTEIIGAGDQGKHLVAARFIAARQIRAPAVRVAWLDLNGRLDLDLIGAAGVDLARVTVLTPRDGIDTINRAFTFLAAHAVHVLVISGLPKLSRRDLLFVGLLERLALLLPGVRTILLCLSTPASTDGLLARLAAVRLYLDNEAVTRSAGRIQYQADLTVLKHRFGSRQPGWRPGAQVALHITADSSHAKRDM